MFVNVWHIRDMKRKNKTHAVSVYLTAPEDVLVERAAQEEGRSISSFIRRAALAAAAALLARSDKDAA